jgi:uncharacterized membrane protein
MNFSQRQTRRSNVALYVYVSLVSVAFGLLVLGLLVWEARELTALGLTGNLFYIVLLLVGLAPALILFGLLRSYAFYRGEHLGGVLAGC